MRCLRDRPRHHNRLKDLELSETDIHGYTSLIVGQSRVYIFLPLDVIQEETLYELLFVPDHNFQLNATTRPSGVIGTMMTPPVAS